MKKAHFLKHLILKTSILIFFFYISACKKAGFGGDATIVAFPEHHGKAIKGATVYIKFNAQDSPGSSSDSYDASVISEGKEDHVHIEGLEQGDYYLYAVGYDSSISKTVIGGIPFTIKRSQRTDEQDVQIPVTE
jgi:hypothetical protein